MIEGIAGLLIFHPAHQVINPVRKLDSRHEAESLLNSCGIGEAVPDISLSKRVLDLRTSSPPFSPHFDASPDREDQLLYCPLGKVVPSLANIVFCLACGLSDMINLAAEPPDQIG